MTNNNHHDDDRHFSRITASPSLVSPVSWVSLSNSKASLRRRQRQVPCRDTEPWLFPSCNTSPLSFSLPSLSLSSHEPSTFYLNLDSLKTLLPPLDSHDRLQSHDEAFGSYRRRHGPSSRERRRSLTRLEALHVKTSHASHKKLRHRKRKRQVSLALKPKTRKKALRLDSAAVRSSSRECLDDQLATPNFSPAKYALNKKMKKRVGQVPLETRPRSLMQHALDHDLDETERTYRPLTPLEDLDEEQRQRTVIAAQLSLTLEEYEHLEAVFGQKATHPLEDEQGSMTERYYEEFQEFDVDDSGSISPQELKQLLLASGEDMDAAELALVMQQADTNHDGEINFTEFIALMRARKRLLHVANQMGGNVTNTTTTTASPGLNIGSKAGSTLPPLKVAARNAKRRQQPQPRSGIATRSPGSALQPDTKVNIGELRRELALSEHGIQELNSKVREGLHWVQQHCPVRSLKTQLFCQRWGMEKVRQLFVCLQSQQMSRAFRKWTAFLRFERNKIKANKFLKCKGSQKLTAIMNRWRRRATRRKFERWKIACIIDTRNEVNSAAIEIQRIVRGSLARVQWLGLQKHVAILHIQALVRGKLARDLVARKRQMMLEHEAACLLQRCYRGFTGKRLARALYQAQRETLAACRIQRTFRNFQQRELLRVIERTKLENDSAIVIQCSIRSYFARRERNYRAMCRLRDRSVLILQRYTRGYLVRCHVAKLRMQIQAALVLQCFFRVCQSYQRVHTLRVEKERKERQALERQAATRIQARWRCFIARKRYLLDKQERAEAQELENQRLNSAIVIQSAYRGFVARRTAQHARYEKQMIFTRMNKSALKIQSFWRGYRGRLAFRLRLEARKTQQQVETKAAKRIQAIVRGKRARNERRRLCQERVKQHQSRAIAALHVQRVFRGHRARKMVQERQQKYREEARLALERLVYHTKTQAATKIQSCARRFLARCHCFYRRRELQQRKQQEARQLKQHHAAIVIQCVVRRAWARRTMLRRRREYEKRISMMTSEKAHDEIERLRREQEDELVKLKMQLMLQASAATEEAAKLKDELARQRENEEMRHKEEAQELARLRLETLMQQQEIDYRIEQEGQKELKSLRLREVFELNKQAQHDQEVAIRAQENEELAALKIVTLLQTRSISKPKEQDKEGRTLEQQAEQLKQLASTIQKDQARMKIQTLCLKYIGRKRLGKLEQAQLASLSSIQDEEQRLRLHAKQQKELTLARLKALMDHEARVHEQEIQKLEAEMLERARNEKDRLARCNASAKTIQSRARGYLARQHLKAIQLQIEQKREDRTKAMQETNEAAEAAFDEAGEVEMTALEEPDEWVEYWDENAQASYFYNIRTQEASWTRPVAIAITETAIGVTDASEQIGNADDASSKQVNIHPVTPAGAENYADEYGYYDQYGQYHYYEQNVAAHDDHGLGHSAQKKEMQANYMAANYAYQAAAAVAFNQAMMYSSFAMGYGATALTSSSQPGLSDESASESARTMSGATEEIVPPDPWNQFFDQYTGAAYYYNNITGERYWA